MVKIPRSRCSKTFSMTGGCTLEARISVVKRSCACHVIAIVFLPFNFFLLSLSLFAIFCNVHFADMTALAFLLYFLFARNIRFYRRIINPKKLAQVVQGCCENVTLFFLRLGKYFFFQLTLLFSQSLMDALAHQRAHAWSDVSQSEFQNVHRLSPT